MIIKDCFIIDAATAKEFLSSSLGLDKWDVEEFCQMLLTGSDAIDWKQEAKEWEKDSMHQFEKRNGLITELQDVADELLKGRKTKRQIADQINNLCEYWY